jgi:flagellar hook-associated protein 3 FlgL
MTLVSIRDMAQNFYLRRQTTEAKAALQRLTTEVTTGRASDLARHVGGDFAALNGIDATLSRLSGYESSTTELGLMSGAMQAALGTIDTLSADLGPALLSASTPSNPTLVNIAAAEGRQGFETTISALNARVGDRALFAGQGTDGQALIDANSILTALATAAMGAVTAADIELAVFAWFDDPAGYAAVAYKGAATLAPVKIGEGQAVQLRVTALDPTIRDTLKGLALAAMLDGGALAGAPAARADLARRAGDQLIRSQVGRTETAARLGVAEAAISEAAISNASEGTALGIARSGIVEIDAYEAATQLQEAEVQLQTIYTLTARLSRLSLVDFLK